MIKFLLLYNLFLLVSFEAGSTPDEGEKILFRPEASMGMLVVYRPENYPPENPPIIQLTGEEFSETFPVDSLSLKKWQLIPGKYQLTSGTFKHIPVDIEVEIYSDKVHYIRISHETGWIDVWYDLLESDQAEF